MKKLYRLISMPLILCVVMIVAIIMSEIVNIGIIFSIFLIIASILFIIMIILKKFDASICIVIIELLFIGFYMRFLNIENNYRKSMNLIKKTASVTGIIEGYPSIKKERVELILRITKVKKYNANTHDSIDTFKILLKINDKNFNIKRGDCIRINKRITIPDKIIKKFDYRKYLYNNNIYGVIYADPSDITFLNDETTPINRLLKNTIWRFRENFYHKLIESLNKESYGFILSIIFGDRNEMDEDVNKKFLDTGLIYLIAISGLQVSFIGLILFKLLNFFLSRSKSLIISTAILAVYILLLVPSNSSLRAFFMFFLYALFFILGISTSGITILALSALILMFINPFSIFDTGFQFSFLAAAGILLLSGIIHDKLPRFIPVRIRRNISVTLSAFFSVFSLQWAMYQSVPFFSLISSIIIVPLFNILYAGLVILIIIFYLSNMDIVIILIESSIGFFIKIIGLLGHIPKIGLPVIPLFFSYMFLPALVFYFYILDRLLRKRTSMIKILLKRLFTIERKRIFKSLDLKKNLNKK